MAGKTEREKPLTREEIDRRAIRLAPAIVTPKKPLTQGARRPSGTSRAVRVAAVAVGQAAGKPTG